jgi:uncharacterized membrane protein YphA (DoxX/SURF4 family)
MTPQPLLRETPVNVVLWIIAALLAVAFAAAGAMKLTQSKEQLVTKGMGWTESFSPGAIKAIGALEVLAGIGLILPALLDIAPVLVPLAALGLVLVMIGAAIVHLRRGEKQMILTNIVLLVLAAVVVWGRLGPYSFTS